MYEWWNELVIFLLAVFNNWAGYVTGGAVVAVLWLWFSVRQQAMGRFVAIGLAVLFAFLAVFKAWRNEHHSSLEQQAQIASLRNPFFGGEILWPLMAPAGPLGHGSLLTVKADVWNTGAPSIAREFVMSTDLPDGRAIQAKSVIQPQIGKRMT